MTYDVRVGGLVYVRRQSRQNMRLISPYSLPFPHLGWPRELCFISAVRHLRERECGWLRPNRAASAARRKTINYCPSLGVGQEELKKQITLTILAQHNPREGTHFGSEARCYVVLLCCGFEAPHWLPGGFLVGHEDLFFRHDPVLTLEHVRAAPRSGRPQKKNHAQLVATIYYLLLLLCINVTFLRRERLR